MVIVFLINGCPLLFVGTSWLMGDPYSIVDY